LWQNSFDGKSKARHLAKKPKMFVPDFLKKSMPEAQISKEAELSEVEIIKLQLAQPRV
jgi:hypothetical protein